MRATRGRVEFPWRLLSTFAYTYDPNGQIQTWSQQADAQTPKVYGYSYDATGQLLSAILHDGSLTGQILKSYAYGYDDAGNRTSEQIDTQVTTGSFNDLNELMSQRTSAANAPVANPSGPSPSVSEKSSRGPAPKIPRRAKNTPLTTPQTH